MNDTTPEEVAPAADQVNDDTPGVDDVEDFEEVGD